MIDQGRNDKFENKISKISYCNMNIYNRLSYSLIHISIQLCMYELMLKYQILLRLRGRGYKLMKKK